MQPEYSAYAITLSLLVAIIKTPENNDLSLRMKTTSRSQDDEKASNELKGTALTTVPEMGL